MQSIKTLNKFYKVLLELENVHLDEEKTKLPDEIEKYFFDDFNLAKVFAYLNFIIKNNSFNKNEIKTTLLTVGKILGIFRCDPNNWFKKEINTKNIDIKIIESLIDERNLARIEKKYILADEIRMKIHDLGVEIKDTPDGVEWDWIKKQ